MDAQKIIEALQGKEIDAEVLSAIKALDKSGDVEALKAELEAEKGKNKGILDDKHKFKERAESAEAKLKQIETEKLPEAERHKQELEEMKQQIESAKKEREDEKAALAKSQYENKLLELTGAIPWSKDFPKKSALAVVRDAMAGVDHNDKSKLDEVTKQITESHKAFIVASAPTGSGSKGGDPGAGGGGEKKSYTLGDSVESAWQK